MNIRKYRHWTPVLGARVYVDPAAVVIGRVTIADDSSIWPGAVLRGDVHSISVGARTSIQDGSVLHVTHEGPYAPEGRALIIGSDVTVGHRVTLHACTVGDSCSADHVFEIHSTSTALALDGKKHYNEW